MKSFEKIREKDEPWSKKHTTYGDCSNQFFIQWSNKYQLINIHNNI